MAIRAAAHRPAAAALWRARPVVGDVAAGWPQLIVELELPIPARERVAVAELANVRLDRLAARHLHDQLWVRPALERRVHRRRERAAEAGVHVSDSEADLGVAERLHRARSAH